MSPTHDTGHADAATTAVHPPAPAVPSFTARSVLLATGVVARVRSTTAGDRDALLELHRSASDSSLYLRFFSVNRTASDAFVDRVCTDTSTTWSLVAELGGRIIGIATAALETAGRAEVALLVAEHLHGQGVGTLLLEQLAGWSAARGVSEFSAEVLAGNGADAPGVPRRRVRAGPAARPRGACP